ncbi:MAG: hypothetical protein HWN69_04670 [Desulfobacterales bacterium]|nr:hypothetical protein [Desulfobacterales bacterium]
MSEDRFLDGKRVLFLGYEYYDYHTQIKETIKAAGAVVDFFPVMKYDLGYTILRNLNTRGFLYYNRSYSRSILKMISGKKYDYVFAIQGFQLPDEFYIELRKLNPRARFLNYHWDSVRKTVYGNTLLDLIPFFDKLYSFDRRDCETYEALHYLPLFYTEEYEELRKEPSSAPRDIDLLFIGSCCQHRRYRHVKRIERICLKQGIKFARYVHVNKRFYIRNFLRGRRLTSVHFRALSRREIIDYYRRSKVIIDLPHHSQAGLTMRVFETLGAGRKLITTNSCIAEEPFYDKRIISIIDPDILSINTEFVKDGTYEWNSVLEDYSISNWIWKIFNETERPSKQEFLLQASPINL